MTYSYDPLEGLSSAVQSGVSTGVTTTVSLLLAVYLSPAEWRLLTAVVLGCGLLSFWMAFHARLAGSGVLSEFGLKYPAVRSDVGLQVEIARLREAIEELQRDRGR